MVGRSRELEENLGRVADGFDFVAGDRNSAVPEDTAVGIHCDNHSVVENSEMVEVGALRLHSFFARLSVSSFHFRTQHTLTSFISCCRFVLFFSFSLGFFFFNKKKLII